MKQTKQAGAAALPKSGYFAMVCILIAGSLWGCLGLFNRHLSALGSPRRPWSCCGIWGPASFSA